MNDVSGTEVTKKTQQNGELQEYSYIFGNRTRFIILIVLLICLALTWCNILTFNIAVLCMYPHRRANGSITSLELTLEQETLINHDPDDPHVIGLFGNKIIWYLPSDKSLLIAAVAFGALVGNFPIVWLAGNYGIRMVFGLLGILSGIVTLLVPLAARIDLKYFLALRFLNGVTFAANFCVIGSFTDKWTYYKQNGLFVSTLVAHFQLAPALTMPIGGILCSRYGWPSVYYFSGTLSVIMFSLFIILYRNSPNKHALVGDIELNKITLGKDFVTKSEQRSVPYLRIIKSAEVWAIWIAAFGNYTCVNLMFLYSPTYLHTVLNFAVQNTGFSAAFPPLLQFAIKICSGFLFNSLAFCGSALCLVALGLMNPDYQITCVGLLACSIGFLGFATGGFFKSAPLIARHYAGFVTGNVSLATTLTMLLIPVTMSYIAPENTVYQWRKLFFMCALTMILTNIIFVIFGSAQLCNWAISQSTMASQMNSIRHATTDTENKLNKT